MSKSKLKRKIKMRLGRPPKHGGFSFLIKSELPENRKHIKQYLTRTRENLIRDLGPTEEDLTAGQAILIDRVITKLGVIRCIEEHIRENTVIVGDNIAPALKQWYLSYNGHVRKDLQLLGISTKQSEEKILTPLELAQKLDSEEASK